MTKYVIEFKTAMNEGISGLQKAANVYVEFIDKFPHMEDSFKQECKGLVPRGVWFRLERVGRGKLHPRLLLGAFDSLAKTQAVSRLPYSLQEKAINGDAFEFVDNGRVIKTNVENASVDAVSRAFCSSGVRNIEAQTKMASTDRVQTVDKSYVLIEGGMKVRFTRNEVFTKKQLIKIVEKMK